MDTGIPFLFASIACGLASVCVVLSLWSFVRLSRVEAKFESLDSKLPGKRILELEQAFDSMTDAFDGHQQKNQQWKQSVHQSVQRMDQIMRRNEATTDRVLEDDGTLNPDVVKGDLPVGLSAPEPGQVAMSTQAALRLRFNKNRGIVE